MTTQKTPTGSGGTHETPPGPPTGGGYPARYAVPSPEGESAAPKTKKIKVLSPTIVDLKQVDPGTVLELPENEANVLIGGGTAEEEKETTGGSVPHPSTPPAKP